MVPATETLLTLDTRPRPVGTIEEARNEVARLEAVELEQKARTLLKENQARADQRERHAQEREKASKDAEARAAEVTADLEAKCPPEMLERIAPFATYTLVAANPSGRIIAFKDTPGGTHDQRDLTITVQQGLDEAVTWPNPPHCKGYELPDHVSTHLAIDPTHQDLVSLRV